jgi:hypothetical protein
MNISKKSLMRHASVLSLSAMMALSAAIPAFAADTVTAGVAAGGRTASVADAALGGVTYSHAAQAATGTMTLTADDLTGSQAGWNVTILSSNFVYTGAVGATPILAANFSVPVANVPTSIAGEAITGLTASTAPGALDSAKKVLSAAVVTGNGTYAQVLNVSLAIPAGSQVGTYTGTLTTTIAAGA